MDAHSDDADLLVIGGGSAGAVLASRASEDPSRRVLLLEAGPDFADVSTLPPVLADASAPTVEFDWGFTAEPDAYDRRLMVPRAKVMGGCSSTNAAIALRGSPTDYDEWGAHNPGWSFADVLPAFRRLETDADFDDEWHGREGPLPIRRVAREALRTHQAAALDAALASGHEFVVDHNRPGAVGAGIGPRNAHDGLRMSTALTYLANARTRPNLAIRANVLVDRVVVRDGRAAGVRLADGEEIAAPTVIVAAGAYGSPAILLRSGIGPAAELRHLGIDVVADLPGVGANLIDHPAQSVDVPTHDAPHGDLFEVVISWRSQRAGSDPYDMHIIPGGSVPDANIETGAVFYLFVGLMRPQSRGLVRLRSADPARPPSITLGGVTARADLVRMVEGLEHARELLRTPPLRELVAGEELKPGADASSAPDLAAFLEREHALYQHGSGTCAMGPDPDAGSVVDARARVYGVEGLLVADASIMPNIPSANTNIPTIMVAERVAEFLAAGHASLNPHI